MIRVLLSLGLCLTTFQLSWGDEPVKLPAPEKVHIYLLIGQSNMAGRGVVEDEDKVPHPRVVKFTKEETWVPAVDPLHFDKPTIAGVGLGSTFGRAMAEANPDVTIALVPCAVGGTPLSRWVKDGDLYQEAVRRLKVALPSGTLKGVLWHQGEGDSGSAKNAESYAERLTGMIEALRAEVGNDELPFVAGELGQFLKKETRNGSPSYWPVVNEQLHAVAKSVPHVAIASSQDLQAKSDQVHFDAPSLREFGRRYAKAMLQLQQTAK